MRARDLIAGFEAIRVSGDLDLDIRSIAFDSHAILPGDLFVALRGGYVDGHEFLPVCGTYLARAAGYRKEPQQIRGL